MKNKTESLRVRITEDEKTNLENLSISILGHKNVSKLLRKLIREFIYNSPELLENELEQFKISVKNLTGISRNLNQITAKINTKSNAKYLTESKINDLKMRVNELNESLKKYVANTMQRYGGASDGSK